MTHKTHGPECCCNYCDPAEAAMATTPERITWREPETGKLEHGTFFAESKFPSWIIVTWNGKKWLVNLVTIVDREVSDAH